MRLSNRLQIFGILASLFVFTGSLRGADTPAAIDPVVGDYVGDWVDAGGKKEKLSGQIRSLGGGAYDGFILLNHGKAVAVGLKVVAKVPAARGAVAFNGTTVMVSAAELLPKVEVTFKIEAGKLIGTFAGEMGEGKIEGQRIVRKSPTLGARPPEGAMVLFDGKNTSHWKNFNWKITPEGALQVTQGNLAIQDKLKRYKLHVEFRVPFMPQATGQERGNSGVYLQSIYEVQVLDSFGLYPLRIDDCGSVYGVVKASGNACLPPLQWQTYDIVYTEGDAANKGAPVITIQHNGITTIADAMVPEKLIGKGGGGGQPDGGALMLQDHGNPVEFRNIWIQPIKD